MNNTLFSKQVQQLLGDSRVRVTARMEEQLAAYLGLIREWNYFAGLVAPKDIPCLISEHLVDAVSLAPWIVAHFRQGCVLLDIGSGGGFPAIPLKVLLPGLALVMVERSAKKVGFLRKVIGALQLGGVSLRHGSFPETVADVQPDIITARAVEKSAKLNRAIASLVGRGAVYLCQSRVSAMSGLQEFHVERVDDMWTTLGLRRGSLHLVRQS